MTILEIPISPESSSQAYLREELLNAWENYLIGGWPENVIAAYKAGKLNKQPHEIVWKYWEQELQEICQNYLSRELEEDI